MASRGVVSPPGERAAEEVNEASNLGVALKPVATPQGKECWRVVKVRRLTADENRSKHNIYIRALDSVGNRVRDDRLRVLWTWEGRSADQEARPAALDKGDADFGHADIPLEKKVHAEIWLEGDGIESDHVVNLHTDHNFSEKDSDGGDGNSWFHHSFLVVFQRQPVQVVTPPVQPTKPVTQPTKPVEPTKPVAPTPVTAPVPAGQFAFAAWPAKSHSLTQFFGDNPADYQKFNFAGHEGIDLAANPGDPVFAVADGTVHMVHPEATGHNYGIHVRISHAGGCQSIYAHLSALQVAKDQPIKAGQVIGLAGSTGNSTGPHLHFSLKKLNAESQGYPGNFIDPLPFLLAFAQSQPGFDVARGGVETDSTPPVGTPVADAPSITAPVGSAPSDPVSIPATASWSARKAGEFWNKYGGYVSSECQRLGIDPADAVGIIVTESSAEPFGGDGRMTIRFENHIFNGYWGKANPQRFADHFAFSSGETWKGHMWRPNTDAAWQPCHVNQAGEWQVLEFARTLDNEAALKSTSMGAGQIMGFNAATVGYPSAQAMFDAFSIDVQAQIGAIFRFMEQNRLVEAVRRQEYVDFARVYNGGGQASEYAARMSDFANAFRSLRATPIDREGMPSPQPTPTTSASSMPKPSSDEEMDRSPMPESPVKGIPLKEADADLYEAWSKHIEAGFAQNEIMFGRILKAFMSPYWATVWMYALLFAIGVIAFIVTIWLAVSPSLLGATQNAAQTAPQTNNVGIFVTLGLSVASFAAFFIRRPLQSLEENLQFITWLGVIYNTYWTTLANAQDRRTYIGDVDQVTEKTLARLAALSEAHARLSKERPNFEE